MDRDAVRDASAAMLGNRHRLEVAAAIGRMAGKAVSATSVAAESGLDYSRVQSEIAWMRDRGLLEPEIDPEKRRKEYRPVDLVYWSSCVVILDQLQVRDGLDGTR